MLATARSGERNPSAFGQGLQKRAALSAASSRTRPGCDRAKESARPRKVESWASSSRGQNSGSARNRMSLAPVAVGLSPS